MVTKVPCTNCGALILPMTAKDTGGLCRPCAKTSESEPPPPAPEPLFIPTPLDSYPSVPYSKWRSEPHGRWLDAAHTFGTHLIGIRDEVIDSIPSDAPEETRNLAVAAVHDSLDGVMQLLDGVPDTRIDDATHVEYALVARIVDTSDAVVEEFELAPDGDGLCMGFAGWWENHFWRDPE